MIDKGDGPYEREVYRGTEGRSEESQQKVYRIRDTPSGMKLNLTFEKGVGNETK